MTVNDVFEKTMSLMDERTETGVVNGDTTLLYKKNTPFILSMLQNELLLIGDLFKKYSISRIAINPIVGNFNIEQHNDTDVIVEGNKVAKAYYFEVDAPGTVYIEDYTTTWNILDTITVPETIVEFTAYKGIVTPTSGATKTRIRFSGDYYYNYRYVALFEQSFKTALLVPDYRPYVLYEMPIDFSSTSKLIQEQTDYGTLTDFKWEGQKDLYIPYTFSGNIRIVYRPVPKDLVALTDTIELDSVLASSILPFGLARELLLTENVALSNYFGSRYEELKFSIKKPRQASNETRNDLYDSSLSF